MPGLAITTIVPFSLTGPTGHWFVGKNPVHLYGSDMAQNFWMAIFSIVTYVLFVRLPDFIDNVKQKVKKRK